jgi:hypothetical protein
MKTTEYQVIEASTGHVTGFATQIEANQFAIARCAIVGTCNVVKIVREHCKSFTQEAL